MTRYLVFLGLFFVAACGANGTTSSDIGETSDFAVLTDAYISANPLIVGDVATVYFFVEQVNDPRRIKWFHWSTSVGGGGKAALATDDTIPFWMRINMGPTPDPTPLVPTPDPGNGATIEVREETAGRTMTVWVEMLDGTLSNSITFSYTIVEVIIFPA